MADQDVHKQNFVLRNLPTRSVTLYPTKAQVFRDLQGVTLKPGANQITIEGLAPTVDEHSVKIEGTGAATITDLSVQLVPNKEFYEDIYPSDDEDEQDIDDDEEIPEKKDDALKAINIEIKKLEVQIAAATEEQQSANARLALIGKYGDTLAKNRPEDLEKFLQEHRTERAKAFTESTAAQAKLVMLNNEIASLHAKSARLNKTTLKETMKAHKKKQKKLIMQMRKREEAQLEKARIKAERVKFWPRKVYKVVISLDAPSGITPASSRRGSIDESVKVAASSETKSETSAVGEVNLSISYITYSASWSPRYDLSLNSVSSSGILDYCAELKNTTSETWQDAKIVLSTSQTSYQGLGDTIPVLQPWNVHLVKGSHYGKGYVKSASNALYSQYEKDHKAKNRGEIPAQIFAPRSELFGLGSYDHRPANQLQTGVQYSQMAYPQAPAQIAQMQRGGSGGAAAGGASAPTIISSLSSRSANTSSGLFGSVNQQNNTGGSSRAAAYGASAPAITSSLFGGSSNAGVQASGSGSNVCASADLFGASGHDHLVYSAPHRSSEARPSDVGSAPQATRSAAPGGGNFSAQGWSSQRSNLGGAPEVGQEDFGELYDADTITPQDPALLFEESSFSDSGLTTTYDVPTLKTMSPTSSTIKHKITCIEFKSVVFSHILIPKLKAAAYLKAKLRNSSKIALIKGPAGLTLDGSFLGQSSIPRCSAGESFTLPLGADPTITVNYAKPTVRRSQSGIFNKEDCEVFTRIATVTNTKANATIELLVLDQVPVSEDERLRIEIASPRGLRPGGDSVTAGQGLSIGGSGAAGNNNSDAESLSGVKSPANKSRLSVYGDSGAKASGTGKEVSRWGSAIASAKKDGEISWNVKILPLKGCKLVLEYEATYPNGETVEGIN